MRLRGLRAGERPVTDPRTDRALLQAEYGTPDHLLDRVALYAYAEQKRDLIAAVWSRLPPLGPDARVLDVGCGPGRYLARLEGPRGYGVDMSAGMAAEARRVGFVAVADAQHLPFAGGVFDAVLSAHMLYHVPDIGAAVAEMARVCKPGGTVIVVTNGRGHLRELRDPIGLEPGDARFVVENAAEMLAPHLTITTLHRYTNRVLVPVPEPVVAYVESGRHFWEPRLPTGTSWDDLIAGVRRRAEATIAAEGVWTGTTEGGIMVCQVP